MSVFKAKQFARGLVTALAFLSVGSLALAQSPQSNAAPTVFSRVLTIDPDRLMEDSLLGRQMSANIEARRTALAEENRRFEESLRQEELDLTQRRTEMDPTAFRVLADSFDEKVQGIRRAQDTKERDLVTLEQQQRRAFLSQVQAVLARLMVERQAAVILDRRSTFLSFDTIDITAAAITEIDALTRQDGTPEPDGDN